MDCCPFVLFVLFVVKTGLTLGLPVASGSHPRLAQILCAISGRAVLDLGGFI
jgi:hypothetical protein